MIRASQQFTKGQRVKLSPRGRSCTFPIAGKFGTVTGFERRDRELVRVRVDGTNTGRAFHMGYWQAVTETAGDE